MDFSSAQKTRFNWRLLIVFLLALAFIGGGLVGFRYWNRRTNADEFLQRGQKAFEEKDWKTAAEQLGQYIKIHKDDIPRLIMYGEAQLNIRPVRRGNITHALAAFRTVLRLDRTHQRASLRAAQIYLDYYTDMAGEAENILERRLKVADDDLEARELLAQALVRQRKFAEAAEELKKNIAKDPTRISSYQNLSRLMLNRPNEVPGDPAAPLKQALRKNPGSVVAHVALSSYYWTTGDKQQAQRLLDEALKCDLSDASDRVRLATQFIVCGRIKEAREQLLAAKKINPKLLKLWVAWSLLARQNRDVGEIKTVVNDALEALGDEAFEFLPNAVEMLLLAGEIEQAKKILEKIRSIDRDIPVIPFLEGQIALASGKPREAVKHFLRMSPTDGPYPRALFALAQAYQSAGDPAMAIRTLEKLIMHYPDDSLAHLSLAKLQLRYGVWERALKHARRALQTAPESRDAQLTFLSAQARVLAERGDKSPAHWKSVNKNINALLEKFPDNSRVLLIAGQIARLQGDFERAGVLARKLQSKEATKLIGGLLEAEVSWSGGAREKAIATLRNLTKAFPEDARPFLKLAEYLEATRRLDECIRCLQEGLKSPNAAVRQSTGARLGQLYIDNDRKDEAYKLLKRLAKEYPRNLRVRQYLLAVMDLSGSAEAQKIIDEIKQIEGEDGFRWRYHQARFWLSQPDWKFHQEKTVRFLKKNLFDNPGDLRSLLLLGQAYTKAGQFNSALQEYRAAYSLAPDNPLVIRLLVAALQEANNFQEAAQVLDDVAERGLTTPKLAGIHLEQMMKRGRIDEALVAARRLLEADPKNPDLKILFARLLARKNKFAEAHKALEGLDPFDLRVTAANVDLLLREGKSDEALAMCNRAVAKLKNTSAYLFRARTLLALGKPEEARADYEAVCTLDPKNPTCWMFLSDFYSAQGKTAEAIKAIEKALGVAKNDSRIVARAWRLYSISGDPKNAQKAEALLDQALKDNPDDVGLKLLHARRLYLRGTTESLRRAHEILDHITMHNRRNVDAWILLAQTALKEDLFETVRQAVDGGLACNPPSSKKTTLMLLRARAEKEPSYAIMHIEDVWKEKPNDATVAQSLALAYLAAGRPAEGVKVLQKTAAKAKGDARLRLLQTQAEVLSASRQVQKALELMKAIAAEFPKEPNVLLQYTAILLRDNRPDEAAELVKKWCKTHPEDVNTALRASGGFIKMAGYLATNPDTSEQAEKVYNVAIRLLEDICRQHADSVPAKIQLAYGYFEAGRTKKSEELYRSILSRDPNNLHAINNLAWLFAKAGNTKQLKEGLELANRGLALKNDFYDLHDTRGVILFRLRQYMKAKADFEYCIRMSKRKSASETSAKIHLAAVLAETEEIKRAIRILEECLDARWGSGRLNPKDKAEAEALLRKLKTSDFSKDVRG